MFDKTSPPMEFSVFCWTMFVLFSVSPLIPREIVRHLLPYKIMDITYKSKSLRKLLSSSALSLSFGLHRSLLYCLFESGLFLLLITIFSVFLHFLLPPCLGRPAVSFLASHLNSVILISLRIRPLTLNKISVKPHHCHTPLSILLLLFNSFS